MGSYVAGAGAVAAAKSRAIKASGAIIRVDAEHFLQIASKSRNNLVVFSNAGYFSRKTNILFHIRG